MDIENRSQAEASLIHAVTVSGLTLSRGERRLFERMDLGLNAGEAAALTGANGVGKTSLLRALAGFIRPDAGEIDFTGADETTLDAGEARGRGLHLLGHLDGLKGGRRVGDELAFQARWLGGDDSGISRAIERFALRPLLDLPVRTLSAGQRRRVALARMVAAPRPLWLLDEPFAPLDADWRAEVGDLMAAHLNGGGLILAAVHDPLPVAARVVDLDAAR